jgi:hypothetical protein
VIRVPPAAPITVRTLPVDASTTIVGVMDDKGRLPGLMKLAGLGGTPKKFVVLGDEKSSISLFMMMPVCSEMNPAPKLKKIILFLWFRPVILFYIFFFWKIAFLFFFY